MFKILKNVVKIQYKSKNETHNVVCIPPIKFPKIVVETRGIFFLLDCTVVKIQVLMASATPCRSLCVCMFYFTPSFNFLELPNNRVEQHGK